MNTHFNQSLILTSAPVWFNNKFEVDKKPVIYKEWYKRGLKTVKDFSYKNGSFLSKSDLKRNLILNNYVLCNTTVWVVL